MVITLDTFLDAELAVIAAEDRFLDSGSAADKAAFKAAVLAADSQKAVLLSQGVALEDIDFVVELVAEEA